MKFSFKKVFDRFFYPLSNRESSMRIVIALLILAIIKVIWETFG